MHENLLASGGWDGSIFFWNLGQETPVGGMEEAHESAVWSLDWHPLGHILVSGSNDYTTRFWTRNRPADAVKDVTEAVKLGGIDSNGVVMMDGTVYYPNNAQFLTLQTTRQNMIQ